SCSAQRRGCETGTGLVGLRSPASQTDRAKAGASRRFPACQSCFAAPADPPLAQGSVRVRRGRPCTTTIGKPLSSPSRSWPAGEAPCFLRQSRFTFVLLRHQYKSPLFCRRGPLPRHSAPERTNRLGDLRPADVGRKLRQRLLLAEGCRRRGDQPYL